MRRRGRRARAPSVIRLDVRAFVLVSRFVPRKFRHRLEHEHVEILLGLFRLGLRERGFSAERGGERGVERRGRRAEGERVSRVRRHRGVVGSSVVSSSAHHHLLLHPRLAIAKVRVRGEEPAVVHRLLHRRLGRLRARLGLGSRAEALALLPRGAVQFLPDAKEKERAPHREDVHLLVPREIALGRGHVRHQKLGGLVPGRAVPVRGFRVHRRATTRDAKVDERRDGLAADDVFVLANEDVSPLDVAVYHPVRVTVRERDENTPRVATHVPRAHLAPFAHRVQVRARVSEEEVRLVAFLAEKRGEQANDVRVARELGQDPRLHLADAQAVAHASPRDHAGEGHGTLDHRAVERGAIGVFARRDGKFHPVERADAVAAEGPIPESRGGRDGRGR